MIFLSTLKQKKRGISIIDIDIEFIFFKRTSFENFKTEMKNDIYFYPLNPPPTPLNRLSSKCQHIFLIIPKRLSRKKWYRKIFCSWRVPVPLFSVPVALQSLKKQLPRTVKEQRYPGTEK